MQYFLIIFLMTSLWGDEPMVEAPTFSYMGDLLKMIFTLAFVIILAMVSVWFLKKIMGSRLKLLNQSNGIKILEKRSLGPKSSLYLIDVLGKGLVISESPAGVHLISEFNETTQVESLLNQRQEVKESKSFSEILANQLKKMGATKK